MSEHQSSPEFQNPTEQAVESDQELTEIAQEADASHKVDFIGKGGEHLVYGVKGHPDVVAKVNWHSIDVFIADNMENGQPLDHYPEHLFQKSKDYLKVINERYSDLRKHFGLRHTLTQRMAVVKIPVTEEIASQRLTQEQAKVMNSCWALVTIQRRYKGLEQGQHFDLTAPYAENDVTVSEEEYEKLTKSLLSGTVDPSEFDKEIFFRLFPSKGIEGFIELTKTDPELLQTLVDFVRKAIKYSSETNLPLDLVGSDNVVLFKDVDGWNYKLLDALYPGNEPDLIGSVKRSFLKSSKGEELDDNELNRIYNTIHYARLVNGLAVLLEIPDRLQILPETVSVEDIPFLDIMDRLVITAQKKKAK